jgi:DNA-binding NtrC family response regulator
LNTERKENGIKKRILIVDDEVDITLSFNPALEDNGLFEVETSNDPLVVLSNYKPNYYDLMLLDIRMPAMNGFELYEKIKKSDNKVKVCFNSPYDVDYNALREQFPSLEIECLILENIMRKPIEVNR